MAPLEVLEGGIAHEMAHVFVDHRRSGVRNFLHMTMYSLLPQYETFDERRADTIVVKRGLGRKLLEFVRYADKRGKVYTPQDGLTAQELQALISLKTA